ncbi:hypothetical protein O1611_g275 [Lasiodiplodia mahajangana]|uniref:Uncharacterized protein n=1 Tax=Lasiodiplodia mahajangana TaxID=1108764 RepID=A0ACC2K191_9PEZI|nr:hypothetical protein O1611_g275 [Lasiodiplodia mahajangana]
MDNMYYFQPQYTMAPPANQTINPATEVVETNNFHQIAQYFNQSGQLTNARTRFTIECHICQNKNIALVNPGFDTLAADSHEKYVVLPRCGHAFGYDCLGNWIKIQKSEGRDYDVSCPSCRSLIVCKEGHIAPLARYGSNNLATQSENIVEIRNKLQVEEPCTQCLELEEERRIANARPENGPLGLEARQRAIRDALHVGTGMRNQNEESWGSIERILSHIHTTVQGTNRRYGYDTMEISLARQGLEESIRRGRPWEEINAQVSYIEEMVEDRIETERHRAEAALQIRAQIAILEGLMRDNFY